MEPDGEEMILGHVQAENILVVADIVTQGAGTGFVRLGPSIVTILELVGIP